MLVVLGVSGMQAPVDQDFSTEVAGVGGMSLHAAPLPGTVFIEWVGCRFLLTQVSSWRLL